MYAHDADGVGKRCDTDDDHYESHVVTIIGRFLCPGHREFVKVAEFDITGVSAALHFFSFER